MRRHTHHTWSPAWAAVVVALATPATDAAARPASSQPPQVQAAAPTRANARPAPPDAYSLRFTAALAALDAGDHTRAQLLFTQAGELAPDAPVWRVHAGVAAALGGDVDGARALFRAALAAGYPASDLAALHATGAEVVGAFDGALAPRADWQTVTARGLRAVPANCHSARFQPKQVHALGGISHLVGKFAPRRSDGPVDNVLVDNYAVDAGARTVRAVGLGDPEIERAVFSRYMYGPDALVFADTLLPWPRGVAFARALRSGLLADDLQGTATSGAVRLLAVAARDAEQLVQVGGAQYRSHTRWLSLDRLDFDAYNHQPPDENDIGIATDEALLARVDDLVGPAFGASYDPWQRVWRLGRDGDTGPLLAFRASASDRHPLLVVLDAEAKAVLHEWHPPADWLAVLRGARDLDLGQPRYHAGSSTLALAPRLGAGLLAVIDTDTWTTRWSIGGASTDRYHHRRRIALRGALLFAWLEQPERSEVRRLSDGALVVDAAQLGCLRVDGTLDGRFLLGQGYDSLFVLDGAMAAAPGRAAPPEPMLALWPVHEGLAVIGCDGVWALPVEALPDAFVLVGDRFVPARELAPWLFDPLHLRSLGQDVELQSRRFPLP